MIMMANNNRFISITVQLENKLDHFREQKW